ncbi:MAG: transglutaminase domain-containing protein [Sulfuricaulis sp.]
MRSVRAHEVQLSHGLFQQPVKGKTAPKDQARALYEWVATKITYAGNCIGIGAVVPRDLGIVLDNKMGDCKDHAALLQALLAARGIQSTQALVNAGSIYRLPKIPVVSTVNHVINYIPAFDLYLDSTSDSTPFGMLPIQDQDKPVLLVEGFKKGAKTPVPPANANQQKTKSILKIARDGTVSGTVEVTQKGESAVEMRAWARKITKEWQEDFVKNAARSQGLIGSGKFEKDDATALTDVYHYKVNLDVEKFIKVPGAGAFYIYPPIDSASSIQAALASSLEVEKEADVTCTGGRMTEEYVIELPKTIKILSIPDNLKIATDILSYEATYKLKDNRLTVKRLLNDKTKGNVCSPMFMAEYKKIGDKVMDDLKSPVLYK